MFETSVVTARAAAADRASLFTVSVAAHSAVVAGAIALSIATVDFPRSAPKAYERAPLFTPVSVPPPLGTGATSRPAARPEPQRPAVPVPTQQTAPALIPETVTPAGESVGEANDSADGTARGGGTAGVPWGVEGGAGPLDAPPVAVAGTGSAPTIYQVSGEVKAPVLLHKVEPAYPPQFVRTGIPATVVVRCIIDRNGRVRDPEIVVAAMAPFNAAVLAAVTQWRFKPGSLRGEAVEVYLDLTVTFRVNR